MITCQCAEAMPTYASQSSYLNPIPSANIERGVIPLDSLPADWWNWLWNNITLNEGRIVQFINSVFSEINSVLSAAGVTPSTASTTDLKTAIQKLATTVATSAVPGSVLSSTLSGKLRVIADGTASINDLGTPDQLETTSKEVVSAINEVLALAQGKAPTSHASSDTTYGVGTTQQYGHVKLCDGASAVTSASGVAATPAAVKSVADALASYQSATNTAVAGKAPTSHASSGTTYGVGTTQRYGHVKVTEGCGLAISSGTISLNAPGYNCTGTVTAVCFNGKAYTPSNGVVNLGAAPSGFPGYGTAICALIGNMNRASSAGTSSLVARADHTHAIPTCIGLGTAQYLGFSSTDNTTVLNGNPIRIGSRTHYLSFTCKNAPYATGISIVHDNLLSPSCLVYIAQTYGPLTCLYKIVSLAGGLVGLGFRLCGGRLTDFMYVDGMYWSSADAVTIRYRPSIVCKDQCVCTFTPIETCVCLYRMRGLIMAV